MKQSPMIDEKERGTYINILVDQTTLHLFMLFSCFREVGTRIGTDNDDVYIGKGKEVMSPFYSWRRPTFTC